MPQLLVVVPAAVPVVSTTLAVKVNGPAAVGIPVMVPSGFNVSPPGRAPVVIEKVNGLVPPPTTRAEL